MERGEKRAIPQSRSIKRKSSLLSFLPPSSSLSWHSGGWESTGMTTEGRKEGKGKEVSPQSPPFVTWD